MKRTLMIEIDCGNKTCASEKGKFCKYLGARKFGQIPVCLLFGAANTAPEQKSWIGALGQKDGWTLRCKECIEHEK